MRNRRAWVAVGAALVVVSLALRLWHRGYAFVGWDLVSAQQGACWWSRGIGPTIAWHRQGSFNPLVWWIFRTPVATLLPGGFAWLWPSPWWPFVTTFAVAVASLGLLAWAIRAPLDVLLLAIAGCAVALTWSVIGFSYVVSAWLPHAMVLAAILRCGTVAATLLIGLALPLAMTGQELGQFCLVPVTLAAFGLAPCRGRVQVVCLLLLPSGWFLWSVAGLPAGNIAGHLEWPTWHWDPVGDWWLPELPIVPLLGLIAVWRLRAERTWWGLLLGLQWAAVAWVAVRSATGPTHGPAGTVWPRRFALVEFYTLAVLGVWARGLQEGTLEAVRRVLLLAALLQVGATVAWARRPLDPRIVLPFSAPDYRTDPALRAIAREAAATVEAGHDVTLPVTWYHDWSNPDGVAAEVWLRVGADRFRQHVTVQPEPMPPWWCE